jgi:excisionase family DNA binding protein
MASNTCDDRYLTPEQAAAYLGYATGTIYNKISRGDIPYKKLGHTVRLLKSELDAWVAQQDAASRDDRAANDA